MHKRADAGIKGYARDKLFTIQKIKETIEDHPGLKSEVLVAKLSINPPYLADRTILRILRSLILDKQIVIDENDEVRFTKKPKEKS